VETAVIGVKQINIETLSNSLSYIHRLKSGAGSGPV
jgi:hypothetical protein